MNAKKKYPLLSSIPGLGPGKIAKLIAQFGSEICVLSAHPSELRMCVSAAMARKIHEFAAGYQPATPETPLADDFAAAV